MLVQDPDRLSLLILDLVDMAFRCPALPGHLEVLLPSLLALCSRAMDTSLENLCVDGGPDVRSTAV